MLIFESLLTVFHLFGDLVADLSIGIMLVFDCFVGLVVLNVDLLDHVLVILQVLNIALVALIEQLVDLFLNMGCKLVVFLDILLLGNDGLLSCELHLNFHFLHSLDLLNIVLLLHFTLPPVELGTVFEAHLHLCE